MNSEGLLASKKNSLLIVILFIIVFFISFLPVWVTIIFSLILWAVTIYKSYEGKSIKTVNELSKYLEEKNAGGYKLSIIIGIILSLFSGYLFIIILSESFAVQFIKIFNDYSFMDLIESLFNDVILSYATCLLVYLGIYIGLQFFISGFVMLPVIREFKKYQFAIKKLTNIEDFKEVNGANRINKDYNNNYKEASYAIKKSRDEWLEKNIKIISKHYFSWSIFHEIFGDTHWI